MMADWTLYMVLGGTALLALAGGLAIWRQPK